MPSTVKTVRGPKIRMGLWSSLSLGLLERPFLLGGLKGSPVAIEPAGKPVQEPDSTLQLIGGGPFNLGPARSMIVPG